MINSVIFFSRELDHRKVSSHTSGAFFFWSWTLELVDLDRASFSLVICSEIDKDLGRACQAQEHEVEKPQTLPSLGKHAGLRSESPESIIER